MTPKANIGVKEFESFLRFVGRRLVERVFLFLVAIINPSPNRNKRTITNLPWYLVTVAEGLYSSVMLMERGALH